MVLPVPEISSWPWMTGKSWNFSRCSHNFDLVLKDWSDIKEWIVIQFRFYLIVLMKIVGSVVGVSFVHLCFRLKLSRIALLRRRLQLDSKTVLTTEGSFPCFFVGIWLFSLISHLHGLTTARFAQNCFPFVDIKSFCSLVWGVFWSVLEMWMYFSVIEISNNVWWALSKQCDLIFYALCVFQAIILASSVV